MQGKYEYSVALVLRCEPQVSKSWPLLTPMASDNSAKSAAEFPSVAGRIRKQPGAIHLDQCGIAEPLTDTTLERVSKIGSASSQALTLEEVEVLSFFHEEAAEAVD